MIGCQTVLAIIPARGGSKGVPRKNVLNLGDKPLIAWTIEEAKKSKYIDKLILSSDDQEIINVAEKYGCEVPFVRPVELAQDDTPGIAPVLHALGILPDYDYVVLLQPTSPFRSVDDIDAAIEKSYVNEGASVVSVTEANENPYWMYKLGYNGSLMSLMETENIPQRRQDAPKAYVLNGAIFVSTVQNLNRKKTFLTKRTLGYILDSEKSIDIDTKLDVIVCEALIKKWKTQERRK